MTAAEGTAEGQELGESLGDASAVLLVSPTLNSAGTEACHDLLATGCPSGENVLLVTYRATADERMADLDRHLDADPTATAIITMDEHVRSASAQSSVTPMAGGVIRVVEQPADLTGLGIYLSEHLDDWRHADEQIVLCFDSLTSLLQYVDVQTAFRFLHVILNQLRRVDGVGHFHIDPAAHDERTVNQLKQLFDAVVRVDDDDVSVQTR